MQIFKLKNNILSIISLYLYYQLITLHHTSNMPDYTLPVAHNTIHYTLYTIHHTFIHIYCSCIVLGRWSRDGPAIGNI